MRSFASASFVHRKTQCSYSEIQPQRRDILPGIAAAATRAEVVGVGQVVGVDAEGRRAVQDLRFIANKRAVGRIAVFHDEPAVAGAELLDGSACDDGSAAEAQAFERAFANR